MTVSTSEDESRRGPPNVRSTSEIGKPQGNDIKVGVNEESFVTIRQGEDAVWVSVAEFKEFLQHLTDWSEQNGIGEDKSDG